VSKDFEELFACLTARNARALVVGGYAVAYHAKPRFTKDIDIFVDPSTDNVERVLQALTDFGFGDLGVVAADFTPGRVVQLGVPPNRADLLTAIDGVSFEEAWAGRAAGHLGPQPVFYIGREDLIRNKRASGRPQDLADVDALEP
jgi:hypothetical protein